MPRLQPFDYTGRHMVQVVSLASKPRRTLSTDTQCADAAQNDCLSERARGGR